MSALTWCTWVTRNNRKVQLGFLFSIGIIVTAITAIRIPQNFKNSTKQTDRTTWVSIEILVSSFVASAPTVYGLLRQRHAQKSKQSNWTGYATAAGKGVGIGMVGEMQKHRSGSARGLASDEEANTSVEEIYQRNSTPVEMRSSGTQTHISA
ncbi:hypothetical protein FGG08_007342 [Glutinoglossum americanum]|uniref:Uncharacterized protein n=1 Tax=Glutinoglossum americanum TaxID=1670608 RepID=A0A9P8I5I9_9PEZI|nr:hypothetical protein FGG08_007342 [Glutinoglossum americanum]